MLELGEEANQLRSDLQMEWVTLQNQFDSYEKYSLLIKLFAIAIVTLLLVIEPPITALVCSLVLWLQDGIWKTYQGRMSDRLLVVEAGLRCQAEHLAAFQLNSEWLDQRPSITGLVLEYIKSSLKPTVAFPHVILTAIASCLLLVSF